MKVPELSRRAIAEPHRPAREIIQRLNSEIRWTERHQKPGQHYEILTATAFGTFTASRIQSDGDHLLQITIIQSGQRAVILAPAGQCSFMVRVFTPSKEHPAERVVVGFGGSRENAEASHDTPVPHAGEESKPA